MDLLLVKYVFLVGFLYFMNNVHAQKNEVRKCAFTYGRPTSQSFITPLKAGQKISHGNCAKACEDLRLNKNPAINGVTVHVILTTLCRCEIGMFGINPTVYSCIFTKIGGICLLRKGELIPRNKIIIPVASSISTSKCVQKCKQQKATNNNLINGFTTNHLTTSTICWCNIGAKYRRNYQSCSIGPLAVTTTTAITTTAASSTTTIPTLPTATTATPQTITTTATPPPTTTNTTTTTATTNTASTLPPPPPTTTTTTAKTTPTTATIMPTTPSDFIEQHLKKLSSNLGNIRLCKHSNELANCTSLSEAVKQMNNAVFNKTTGSQTDGKEKKTEDIIITTKIVKEIVNTSNESMIREITPVVIGTLDHLAGTSAEEIATNEDVNYISTNVLNTMDVLLEKLTVALTTGNNNSTVKVSAKNIALSVAMMQGAAGVVILSSIRNDQLLQVQTEEYDDYYGDEENKRQQNNKLSIITIPKETFKQGGNAVSSVIYREPFLFPMERGCGNSRRRVGTIVHAVKIGNLRIENLQQPILLDFKNFANNVMNGNQTAVCSFWQEAENNKVGQWSNSGCLERNGTANRTICQCDHLTNFAVLFDVSQNGYDPVSLELVTSVGCWISLSGLTLTVLAYLSIRKLRRKLQSKILLNLCVTMIALLVTFLVGVEKTNPRLGCQVVAGLIQFFLLSMFCWMAVEGVNLYESVVVVFEARREGKFLKIASAVAYGLPLIVVVVNAALAPKSLGNERFCVLHGYSFYFGLVLPVLTIVLINYVILAMTVAAICKADKSMARMKNFQDSSMRLVRVSLSCTCIMGLTWLFGALAIGKATVAFQWLFTIFNSLQGFFIFIFYTVRNEDVIKAWKKMRPRKKDFTEITSSDSADLKLRTRKTTDS